MLALLAVGLACYALWKLVQGVLDADGKSSAPHGILRRVGYVGSAAIHGTLAFTAAQSILGAEDSSEDAATASALAYQPPLGQILVGLVGLSVIVVGLYQFYAAYKAMFRADLRLDLRSYAQERWVTYAGRVGTAARALAISLAGASVVLPLTSPTRARPAASALRSRVCNNSPWAPTCSALSPWAFSSTASLCSLSPATGA